MILKILFKIRYTLYSLLIKKMSDTKNSKDTPNQNKRNTDMLTDCPVEMLAHQKQHVQNIWDALVRRQQFSFIETSQTGLGKTFIILNLLYSLQKKYNMKAFLVAPSDTSLRNDSGWLPLAEKFGVKFIEATTYSALRGKSGNVKHDWIKPDPNNKKNWICTDKFMQLCKRGVFFIFDESHHVKNHTSSQSRLAISMVRTAKRYRDTCRVALVSHTPGESDLHAYNLLQMAGVMTRPELIHHIPFTRDYEYEEHGLGELIRLCLAIDPSQREFIENMLFRICKKKALEMCKSLYQRVIRQRLTFSMIAPEESYKVERLNAFLEIDPEQLANMEHGVDVLARAVDYRNGEVGDRADWDLANVALGIRAIERAKLPAIARYVVSEYKRNPNKKFIISCGSFGVENQYILQNLIYRNKTREFYIDIFKMLKKENSMWKNIPSDIINYYLIPMLTEKVNDADVLNGKTNKNDRLELIRSFQSSSDKTWCLIVTPGLASESISLHDVHGNHPRELIISPTYFFNQIVQGVGRITRIGTKSDCKISLVYGKGIDQEQSIFQIMMRKSVTARDLLSEGQNVVFPNEYPTWIENE